jgi:hypothetical protein
MNQTTMVRAVRDRDGTVYLFRDIHEGSRLVGVQYGVVESFGTHVTWIDTEEGVAFDEIKPLFPSPQREGPPKGA